MHKHGYFYITILFFFTFNLCFSIGSNFDDIKLTGGHVATNENLLPSTVFVQYNCTAAKIDTYLFITAAHCLLSWESKGLRRMYHAGGNIFISNNKDNSKHHKLTIKETFIHPFYQNAYNHYFPNNNKLNSLSYDTFDIAIFEVEEETNHIPSSEIDFNEVYPGDKVIITGYGCEEGLTKQSYFSHTPRFKFQETKALGITSLIHFGGPGFEAINVFHHNIITPGMTRNSNEASICPGDSGGPLYKVIDNKTFIVGINAYYSFNIGSKISRTNWHTRISSVAYWIKGILYN